MQCHHPSGVGCPSCIKAFLDLSPSQTCPEFGVLGVLGPVKVTVKINRPYQRTKERKRPGPHLRTPSMPGAFLLGPASWFHHLPTRPPWGPSLHHPGLWRLELQPAAKSIRHKLGIVSTRVSNSASWLVSFGDVCALPARAC